MSELGPVRSRIEATNVQMHRDAIADTASRAAIYAGHVCDYAQIQDDRGLKRAVLMLSLCAASAAEALPALAEAADSEVRLMAAARGAQPAKPSLADAAQTERDRITREGL